MIQNNRFSLASVNVIQYAYYYDCYYCYHMYSDGLIILFASDTDRRERVQCVRACNKKLIVRGGESMCKVIAVLVVQVDFSKFNQFFFQFLLYKIIMISHRI